MMFMRVNVYPLGGPCQSANDLEWYSVSFRGYAVMRCRRGLRGRVGFASRCAPIGPLATPRDPRARLCPQAGRTDASPVRPARATPDIEACPAARFSAKADDRARCATAEARHQRGVLRDSSFRHARRALRFASRPAASGGGPRGDDSPFAQPAAGRSPVGGAGPASATRFRRAGSRWRRPRRAQRPRRGCPPRLAANAAPARFVGAKGAPAAEGTPSAPSKWMQPEGRAPAAGLASAAGACGQWDAPFPRGVEAPLRAHGFRSATRTERLRELRTPED